MDPPYTRTKFHWLTSDALCASFKKLIVSTPRLLRNLTSDPPCSSFEKLVVSTLRLLCYLHTMSLAQAVPDSLKDYKCVSYAVYTPYSTRVFLARLTRSDAIRVIRPDH